MDAKTLTALKGSIEHWEDNLAKAKAGKSISISASDCALCSEFFDHDCGGCPVARNTGREVCGGTPYAEIERIFRRDDVDITPYVQSELDFLTSLLPGAES